VQEPPEPVLELVLQQAAQRQEPEQAAVELPWPPAGESALEPAFSRAPALAPA